MTTTSQRKSNTRYIFIVSVLIIAALGIWSWQSPRGAEADTATADEPAHVELIEGTELSRVVLTQKAAERLDIQTADARDEQIGGTARRVIPYSAVLYDENGNAWTYTSPEALVYVRQAVTIERIEGDLAILTEGPAAGTKVVSVGGAMLYGTEYGVGH